MVLAIPLHGISEGLPANDSREMAVLFAMAASKVVSRSAIRES
jgi:hypothetical protein